MERCKIEILTKIVKTLKRKTYRAGARSRCETVYGATRRKRGLKKC